MADLQQRKTSWIRVARQREGLTLEQLAARAGVSKSYLWELEKGRRPHPSHVTINRIAAVLGVPLDQALGERAIGERPSAEDEDFYRAYLALNSESKAIMRSILDTFISRQKQLTN